MAESTTFMKGDIVRNIYAGDNNPDRYLLYLGKSTVKQGRYTQKCYLCINHSGEKVHTLRSGGVDNLECTLEKIGHMDEFDQFMSALKELKTLDRRVEDGKTD